MVGEAGLDFEAPADADTGNDYVVTVTATDSSGGSSDVEVTITVTDVNEAPVFPDPADGTPPTNTMGMAADHQEDATELVIAGYTATDPEEGVVTLSLMGDDAALFELAADTDTGAGANRVLSWKEMPDFENPGDRNGDNIYEVTIRASDSVLTTDRMITIKVTDRDEAGEVEVSQDALIGVELTATLSDSDTGAPDPARFIDQVWQWHRLAAADITTVADTNAIDGADSPSYTPVVADRGSFLAAVVTYTDRTRDEDNNGTNNTAGESFVGFTNEVTSNATTAVRNNPVNSPPVFEEGASTIRLVEENTVPVPGDTNDDGIDDEDVATEDNPDDNVGGGPVVAEDIDQGQTVAYTLSGSDMFRVRSNGQIEVSNKADLDHETKDTYTVTLTATDTSGAANNSASIEVTIYVTDLDERPVVFEGGLAISGERSVSVMENSDSADAVATYMASGADAASATWTLAGYDADDFMVYGSGESVMLMFQNSPDYEAPADADGNNDYEVTLEATDGNYMNSYHVTVTVTNVEEDGTVALSTETPVVGVEVTADLTDPDGDVSGMTWQWASAGDDGVYSDIEGETSAGYTPDAGDVGMTLRATAAYNDGHGNGKSAMDATDSAVVELTVSGNSAPTIAENVATVGTYTASAPGADWSVSGDDAGQFSIAGGVLRFNTAPDFENPADTGGDNVYNVTVVASYGTATPAEMDVAVTVTDVDEGPVERYDSNDDGVIDLSELFDAIDAYFADAIDIGELFEVIDAYFAS